MDISFSTSREAFSVQCFRWSYGDCRGGGRGVGEGLAREACRGFPLVEFKNTYYSTIQNTEYNKLDAIIKQHFYDLDSKETDR